MTAHPIIFRADSVAAILAGRKTQTRRVVRPHPTGWTPMVEFDGRTWAWCVHGDQDHSERRRAPCAAGDVLWVREQWAVHADWTPTKIGAAAEQWGGRDQVVWYRADGHGRTGDGRGPWRSPIYMPKWACRLLLIVESVRTERLSDITEVDALAEGCISDETATTYERFAQLWASFRRPPAERWTANPWVWVVEVAPTALK